MKILFVGSIGSGQTSQMRLQVLRELGHDVQALDSAERWRQLHPIMRRAQQWSCRGSVIDSLNQDVVRSVGEFRPELLWAEKQEFIRPETLTALRRRGVRLLHFTPDPYFTLEWKRTRLMDDGLALFDYLVTSKQYELREYGRFCSRVIYMPLGFAPSVHRPLSPASREASARYASDVSFLGGWEPRRQTRLDAVARLPGISLRIWGYGWDHVQDGRISARRYLAMRRNAGNAEYSIRMNPLLASCLEGNEVYEDEYAWAISGARISLGFLRQVCPDQHTTRTFEIPACGSMMLADRTDEHQEMFTEGEEAEFFETDEEMLDKLRYYLRNEGLRERVARCGFERCHSSGYSYTARISEVMKEIEH